MFLLAKILEWKRKTYISCFEEIVDKLKLTPLLGKSLFALSGGQKQKIACASVATLFPQILVMDEPSSNLDIEAI